MRRAMSATIYKVRSFDSFLRKRYLSFPLLSAGPSSSPLGCKELRSKRYISDGQCSSLRPLVEVVCAGACLPLDQLPWYTDSSPATPTQGPSWTCSVGLVRSKRIHLLCPNGERKTYKVPVVRACKCVREPQVSQGS